jgi:hypothetical protein
LRRVIRRGPRSLIFRVLDPVAFSVYSAALCVKKFNPWGGHLD